MLYNGIIGGALLWVSEISNPTFNLIIKGGAFMQTNWEKSFYEKQFHFTKTDVNDDYIAYYNGDAQLILEQYGKPFSTVLELGAGKGFVANELAKEGKQVTTIELVEEITDYARRHAHEGVNVLNADFYQVQLPQQFDAVLYLDGFGVGNDADQLRLLERIHHWLTDDGYALIDIYEPNYWQKTSGIEMYVSHDKKGMRKYGYDEESRRMTDTWWQVNEPSQYVTQSLACYSPEEINELCKQANLQIIAYYPSGAMDYDTWTYTEVATLNECWSYRIKVRKKR